MNTRVFIMELTRTLDAVAESGAVTPARRRFSFSTIISTALSIVAPPGSPDNDSDVELDEGYIMPKERRSLLSSSLSSKCFQSSK